MISDEILYQLYRELGLTPPQRELPPQARRPVLRARLAGVGRTGAVPGTTIVLPAGQVPLPPQRRAIPLARPPPPFQRGVGSLALALKVTVHGQTTVAPSHVVRQWIEAQPGRVRLEGELLRGTTAEERVKSLYKLLNSYDAQLAFPGNVAVLTAHAESLDDWDISELLVARPHTQGPFPVFCSGASGTNCFLAAVIKRWPSMEPLCKELAAKWREADPDAGVDATRVSEFIKQAGSRKWYNKAVGVEFCDRAGAVWSAHNVTAPSGARREPNRILRLIAGCHHVELATGDSGEWNGKIVDVPQEEFINTLVDGRWGRIVHPSAFLRDGVLYRNEGFVAELIEDASRGRENAKTYLTYDPLDELARHPMVGSLHGLTAAVFEERAGVASVQVGDPMEKYLAAAQIEHTAVRLQPFLATDVEYDANSCFASYRNGANSHYYRRYGLPHLPKMGGWLPDDITPAEEEVLLAQTGFALIDEAVPHHWTLEVFPYLLSGQVYPTVWLRFVRDSGLGSFKLRHIMLGGKFYDPILAGGDIIRKVIGRWVLRSERTTYYASTKEEAERLCWSRLGHLCGIEASHHGGYMVHFEEAAKQRFPHLRAQVLAYSHIAVFDKLKQLARETVIAVNTDSVTLRDRDEAVFPSNGLKAGILGGWKVAQDARRDIYKTKLVNGTVQRVEPKEGGVVSSLRLSRPSVTAVPPQQSTAECKQAMTALLRGDAEKGVSPMTWETSYMLPITPWVDGDAPLSGFHQVPLVITLQGGAGHGKTSWAAIALPALALEQGYMAHTAFQRETVHENASQAKFGPDCPGSTLHSMLFPREENMKIQARKVRNADILVVDEASMLTQELLDKLLSTSQRRVLVLAGDHAQLPDVRPGEDPPLYGPFKDAIEGPGRHKIDFQRDHRSVDGPTAKLKAELRVASLSDRGGYGRHELKVVEAHLDATQLYPPPGVTGSFNEALSWLTHGRDAVDIACNLRVICGTTTMRDRVNNALFRQTYGLVGRQDQPAETSLVPLRCSQSSKKGVELYPGNAGERRVEPWATARKMLMTKRWSLGFASTVHAVQGKTIDLPGILAFIPDWLPPGLVNTAISRVRDKRQLRVLRAASPGIPGDGAALGPKHKYGLKDVYPT